MNAGISAIEVALVLGIIVIIFALSSPVILDFYLSYQLIAESRTLAGMLGQARNFAIINYNSANHGVYVDADDFVLFEGDSYALRDPAKDKDFPRVNNISFSGNGEVVFEALSGRTSSSTLTISNGQRSESIYVNEEGRIQQ